MREYAYRTSFDLILRAHSDNEIGVMLTSDSVVLQQLESVPVEGPGGGVDRETYRFEAQSGEDRIEANEETSRVFDVWYTLPNGGREALIAVSLDFVGRQRHPLFQGPPGGGGAAPGAVTTTGAVVGTRCRRSS